MNYRRALGPSSEQLFDSVFWLPGSWHFQTLVWRLRIFCVYSSNLNADPPWTPLKNTTSEGASNRTSSAGKFPVPHSDVKKHRTVRWILSGTAQHSEMGSVLRQICMYICRYVWVWSVLRQIHMYICTYLYMCTNTHVYMYISMGIVLRKIQNSLGNYLATNTCKYERLECPSQINIKPTFEKFLFE